MVSEKFCSERKQRNLRDDSLANNWIRDLILYFEFGRQMTAIEAIACLWSQCSAIAEMNGGWAMSTTCH